MNTALDKKPPTPEQDSHTFTLLLESADGKNEITEELENALFAAGCDDALLGSEDGRLFLNFDRKGNNFDHAIATAIQDTERSALVRVIAVIPPGFGAIEKFNAFLKLRRESTMPELQKAFERAIPEIIRLST